MSQFIHHNEFLAILGGFKQFLEINYRLFVFLVVAFKVPVDISWKLVLMNFLKLTDIFKNFNGLLKFKNRTFTPLKIQIPKER